MLKKMQRLCLTGLSSLSLLMFSPTVLQAGEFATSVDPGGCLLDHIAVDPDTRQFQFDGLSADGSKIVIGWDRGKDERGTYVLNLKTGERTDVPGMNNGGVFSPDGKTLVNSIYVEGGKTNIAEFDLATQSMTLVAPHSEWDWLASYSSDGQKVLFNSYRTGKSDIYTYDKSTEEIKRWTDFDGYEAHGQFSPDDSRIMFNRLEGEDDFNLFVIDVATGDISQLTDEPSEEGYGSWSPDGKTIVFSSDRGRSKKGVTDLYLMDLQSREVRQLTNMEAKDGYPFFSSDGKYVYFNSDRKPEGVYRISLQDNLQCVK